MNLTVLVMFVSAYSNPIPVAARGRNKSRAKATSVLSLGSNAPVDTSHIQQSQQSPHVLVPMKPEVPLEMSPSSSSVNKDLQEQVVQTRNSTIQQSSSTVNQNQDPAQQEVPSVETHERNSPPATQVSLDNLSDQGDPEVVSTSLESSPEFSIPDMNEMAEKIATPYSQEGGFDEGLPLQATVSQTLFPANPIILQRKNLYNVTSTLNEVAKTFYAVVKLLQCLSNLTS